MCYALNDGWEKVNSRKNKTTKSRKREEKETYKYLGMLEVDTIKQVEMKEKNKKMNEETC